ncbi:MAG TPA: hypothetical protein VLE69_03235 [Candidatus Saccharimonadales bacterium]|nr:hypothetical protein [Candidatus Saccharimonadales bacterium]
MERYSQPNPEVLGECELDLMHSSNLGDAASYEIIQNTVVAAKRGAALLRCPKYGCQLLIDGGTLVNPSDCELVKCAEKEIPVELR